MGKGDTAYVYNGPRSDFREIFYSNPDQALTIPVQFMGGYGLLPAGTLIALNLTTASDYLNRAVPYNPTTLNITTQEQPGRAFILTDVSSGEDVEVTPDDSYKFNVGDDIIIMDDNSAAEDLGAITAIDRTTYLNKAVITATNTISGSFAGANLAAIWVKAGDSSNNYSDAAGVLMKAVDTGVGVNAKGAGAQIVVSNAIFLTGMLNLKDSAGATDISLSDIGNYSYLK